MARTKRAARIRKAQEFPPRSLLARMRPPVVPAAAYSWDLPAIMAARDAQQAGRFSSPVKLAASMRTDDALFVARKNRIAPLRSLSVAIDAARGARADTVAGEAEALFGQDGIATPPETIAAIHGDLADHAVAVAYNDWQPRDDGSRVDLVLRPWPLEFVWWDPTARQLMTQTYQTEPGLTGQSWQVPIVHGDGRWVVFVTADLEAQPWRTDAAVLPGSLVWAAHAFAVRAWSRGSDSHGNAKVVGELPEGVPLQEADEQGTAQTSPEALAFLELLEDIASLDSPVGIRPAGAKVDYLVNSSQAWQVWERLSQNREKAAARIYLGTDGTLGSQGGAPGVDISELFGVATTIVQGDKAAIERGIRTGSMEPWAAVNFGDSSLCPRRRYVMPDPDEHRAWSNQRERTDAYLAALATMQGAGLLTPDMAKQLAEHYGVAPLRLEKAPPEMQPALRAMRVTERR